MVEGLEENEVISGGLEITLTVPDSSFATHTIAEPGREVLPGVTIPKATGDSPTGISTAEPSLAAIEEPSKTVIAPCSPESRPTDAM
jgi:hypothetical protein